MHPSTHTQPPRIIQNKKSFKGLQTNLNFQLRDLGQKTLTSTSVSLLNEVHLSSHPAILADQPACPTTRKKIAPEGPLLSSVDPYIGTGAHGHTFLGASVPFGAVQVGPTNINKGWDWCSGYHYSDSVVIGFGLQNHLSGTGIPDLCDILLMPYTGGDVRLDRFSSYDHGHEIARPDYYSVWLKDQHIKVGTHRHRKSGFPSLYLSAGYGWRFYLGSFSGQFRHRLATSKSLRPLVGTE